MWCSFSPPLATSRQPTLLRTDDDIKSVTEAASAFWHGPVQPANADDRSVEGLPFVNRVPNLEAAMTALTMNQRRAWSESTDRRYQLVFGAQMFGVGKSAFGKKLAEGLKVGIGGRLAYHR